jgi:hypothetical protein
MTVRMFMWALGVLLAIPAFIVIAVDRIVRKRD